MVMYRSLQNVQFKVIFLNIIIIVNHTLLIPLYVFYLLNEAYTIRNMMYSDIILVELFKSITKKHLLPRLLE